MFTGIRMIKGFNKGAAIKKIMASLILTVFPRQLMKNMEEQVQRGSRDATINVRTGPRNRCTRRRDNRSCKKGPAKILKK
jgi:hypothetical protein